MKKIIALFPVLYFTTVVAQNSTPRDSLYGLLNHTTNPHRQMDLLKRIGEDYGYTGQPDSVRFVSQQMFKIATDENEDSLLSWAYLQIGNYYTLTSDFKQALEYEFKSLALAEKSKSRAATWLAAKELSINFKQIRNFPEALKYLKKSEPFIPQGTSMTPIALNRSYSHLSEIYLGMGQIDSALRYVQLANEITSKNTDSYGFARILYIFATVYKAKGDADLAESYYKKCIAFSDSENVIQPYINATTDYGQYLLNIAQPVLSKKYALAGFNKAKWSQYKLAIINSAALLRSVYTSLGQKDSAYYFADIKDAYRDSVFNEQQLNQIQNIAFAQQIKEKEDEARLSEEKKQRQQNIQYALIALGIIIFIILFLLLSRSVITSAKMIEFLGVIALLIVFEFLNLLLHPFLERITDHSPVLMLLALVCIAALLVPLHHKLEKWATHKLVEKNKALRLAAAKKTIERLESDKESKN